MKYTAYLTSRELPVYSILAGISIQQEYLFVPKGKNYNPPFSFFI